MSPFREGLADPDAIKEGTHNGFLHSEGGRGGSDGRECTKEDNTLEQFW